MRFAFVTIGSFSGINERVLENLQAEFPELEAEHLDIVRWVRRRRALLVANLLYVLVSRGPRPFSDRGRLWGAFFRTRLIFTAIRREMRWRLARAPYAFSFQTQSLFDASAPGTPHFLFTDHTELVNRHYPDFAQRREPPRGWLGRERRIYEHARINFTMGGHVARSLIEDYGIEPSHVSCVGAGSNVAQAALVAIEPDYASGRILFVGRQWERKGGPDLLAAFELVRRSLPEASLAVVGCTPQLDREGVEVLGEVPAQALPEQYARAAVYCMPSLVEPFGVVFVEAAMAGLPVVANAIGALPEIVADGESGYLVAPHDVPALARSLEALLGDPERARRFGEAGRARALARYTWPQSVGRVAAQIREAIGSPAP